MKYRYFLLILILCLGIIFRFYNYSERILFSPEQAISLITSGRMIKEKFSLLGEQNVQRTTSFGHRIHSGALFSYTLIPLQLIFDYDPIPITILFGLLNLFIGALVYVVAKKISGELAALFSFILFMTNATMIYHSTFIWNQNYVILVGILTLYLLNELKVRKTLKTAFFLGLLSGIAISIEYFYLFTLILVLVFMLKMVKKRLHALFVFIIGVFIPNIPAVIFDLRHEFYYSRTLLQYLVDVISGVGTTSIHYYHFLQFIPLVLVLFGVLLKNIYQKNKVYAIILTVFYIYFNVSSSHFSLDAPVGMPSELTVNNIYKAAEIIKKDNAEDFNVAVLVDFDSRGHILRYPLEFEYGIKPMGVTDYPVSSNLYVLTENNYDFDGSNVWELSGFIESPGKKIADISNSYAVYKYSK